MIRGPWTRMTHVGKMLEGQNDVDGVYSGLPEGGNLQVRFQLSHLVEGLTIELL
jgi:hypothetical protein